MNETMERILEQGAGLAILFCLLGIPVLLTIFHLYCLFVRGEGPWFRKWRVVLEVLTLLLGPLYSVFYAIFLEIGFRADWHYQLYNSQKHTPIATWTLPTLLTLTGIGVLGYFILRLIPLKYMPPLVVVTGIACSYAGILVSVLWCIQIWGLETFWLVLFPANWVMLVLIQIKNLIYQWEDMQWEKVGQQETETDAEKIYRNPFLQKCNEKLQDASTWPVAALVLFLPLLGILLAILALFGQSPDSIIQAFTQTSQWNLSAKVSPQNLYYDEHYLCTVAAGGHRKVVRPLRMGRRHGHAVIVNRQLCVANAFEQILEEKLPRTHKAVRRFYDTYGFPVAKLIRSPFAADVVYVLMKPLEWLFLLIIYFNDTKPENRIAIQYLPPEEQKRLKAAC